MTWFVHYNYWIVIVLMMVGLYLVMARHNLARKVIGLNIFQTSVFVFFISMGAVRDSSAPILAEGIAQYANPLPHVLILTAIVVGVSTTSLALALIVRINEEYESIDEERISLLDGND
ncbi:MAG: Na+/H+ antiporter subunit C [Gammaproteobacteria bacterium]|nr:Na+/H+ antiporter subunit C [Gammaproteobacteria bacterium]|tara:strand:+ start:395 stop:748 length:354 start_codon:yes stop_codon:yes gene_type:complete